MGFQLSQPHWASLLCVFGFQLGVNHQVSTAGTGGGLMLFRSGMGEWKRLLRALLRTCPAMWVENQVGDGFPMR